VGELVCVALGQMNTLSDISWRGQVTRPTRLVRFY